MGNHETLYFVLTKQVVFLSDIFSEVRANLLSESNKRLKIREFDFLVEHFKLVLKIKKINVRQKPEKFFQFCFIRKI